jgi:hypothetical protein
MKTLYFSKAQISHTVLINQDQPYLLLAHIDFGDFEVIKDYSKFNFRIICKQKNSKTIDNLIDVNSYIAMNHRNNVLNFNSPVVNESDYNIAEVEFVIDKPEAFEGEFKLVIETRNYFVEMKNPWRDFEAELEENGNNRILFSAPFGQGKTTFLKKFFEKKEEKYEVFHLFPVNYAIASNEDIFRYIKAEIFYKLILKGVSFDQETIPHKIAFPFYVQKHLDKVLLPLVRLFPKIGGDIYPIANNLVELKESYLKEFEMINKGEESKVMAFLDKLHDEEGSLFEDNFYTQLIRKLLEQVKTEKKKTVLVIDDTDRMDPDHIFRILNVFAAHFDSPDYMEGDSNKFGFDKIVIVCDYENLHRIFSHKYGPRTDFAGYIDKFFSKCIFRFDNSSSIHAIINSIVPDNFNSRLPYFELIISDLIKTENISLREVLKLKESQLARMADTVMRNGYSSTSLAFLHPTIHALLRIFSSHILKEKLKSCQSNITEKNGATSKLSLYNSNSIDIVIALIKSTNGNFLQKEVPYLFRLGDKRFRFEFENQMRNDYIKSSFISTNNNDFKEIKLTDLFDAADFYELLILLVERYTKFQIENKILN